MKLLTGSRSDHAELLSEGPFLEYVHAGLFLSFFGCANVLSRKFRGHKLAYDELEPRVVS